VSYISYSVKTAVRLDRSSIDTSLRQPYVTEDGTLICDATFARDGILLYKRSDGSTRREFRPPEENKKALTEFGITPVTREHPTSFINEYSDPGLRKGITLPDVRYDVVPGKGGFVRGAIAVMDSALVKEIQAGHIKEISSGYRCDIEEVPGVWVDAAGVSHHYDAIQRNIKVNHHAVTIRGRAGPDVGIHLDSADADLDIAFEVEHLDSDNPPKPMTTTLNEYLTLTVGNTDIRLDAAAYAALNPVVSRVDALEAEVTRKDAQIVTLENKLDAAEHDRDTLQGRYDANDLRLANAEYILEALGYRADGNGDYIKEENADACGDKEDGGMKDKEKLLEQLNGAPKGKEGTNPEDDEEMEDKEDMKKKDMGMGHSKEKTDSINPIDLKGAIAEAERLIPGFTEVHFDSVIEAQSVTDIRRMVVSALKPNLKAKLDNADKVETAYSLITANMPKAAPQQSKQDGDRYDYASELQTVIGAASSLNQEYASTTTPNPEAWQKPLSLSLDRP
jgi:hypothetical protein